MISRRQLIQNVSGTFAAPLMLSRADAQVTPDIVQYSTDLEPLVRLIEQIPRDKAAELLVEQMNRGVPYKQLMAALFLAGVRNVNPRPPGFALHCVFVIHSAHLLGQQAPADSRLLPLFYAIDNFKTAQDRDAKQSAGYYTLRALSGALPAGKDAAAELSSSMETWEVERAERAVAALARSSRASDIVGSLRKYGARDYRNIGHKAIYVANAYRTLDAIGWQHAEPVLRSLVLALLDFGAEQEVNGYKFEDQCYTANLRRVKDTFRRLPASWTNTNGDTTATRELLTLWRTASPDEICADLTTRLVASKVTAGSVWDAVHLASAELSMRARGSAGIVGIHAVTSANALRHAYAASRNPEMQFLLLLQGAGWMGQFRTWAEKRAQLGSARITDLEPSDPAGTLDETVAAVYAGIPSNVDVSAARVMRIARDAQGRKAFLNTALRTTAAKADEVHYYKYLAALIEDIPQVSAAWQPHLTAGVVYYSKGAGHPDSQVMMRAREAMKSLRA